MNKVQSYLKNYQQQQQPIVSSITKPVRGIARKEMSSEVTNKVDTISKSSKTKQTSAKPALSNEHSTSYQKAMAFWKR